MRYTQVIEHLAVATRTSSGTGDPVYCGSFASGQLVVRVLSVAGVGAYLRPRWQSSADRSNFGDFVSGATLLATGVRIVSAVGGIGAWARMRWTQSATALQWSAHFVLTE